MLIRCKFETLLIIVLLLLPLAATNLAQGSSCDLRLNVFLLQKSDYPQNTPLKNTRATLVDLDTNATLTSRLLGGVPYFTKLSQGEYNLVVGKDGFRNTVKRIRLKCDLADEKDVFSEIIFLSDDKKSNNYRMTQIDYQVPGEYPAIPPSPLATPKADSSVSVLTNEVAVNERAVYLPSPAFSAEAEKTRNELVTELISFVVSVNIEIDEKGNVRNASVSDRDSRVKELVPFIIESAKKAKFVSVKVKGKEAVLLGFINYVFSK